MVERQSTVQREVGGGERTSHQTSATSLVCGKSTLTGTCGRTRSSRILELGESSRGAMTSVADPVEKRPKESASSYCSSSSSLFWHSRAFEAAGGSAGGIKRKSAKSFESAANKHGLFAYPHFATSYYYGEPTAWLRAIHAADEDTWRADNERYQLKLWHGHRQELGLALYVCYAFYAAFVCPPAYIESARSEQSADQPCGLNHFHGKVCRTYNDCSNLI